MPEVTESSAPLGASEESEVERLAHEVAELRAQMERLQADRPRPNGHAPDAAMGQRDPSAKRRRGRRRPSGSGEAESSGLVSRRRLFGLLGGAAAVGTGLAVAGSTLAADPAGAADDSAMLVGANANSNPGLTTTLTGSTSGADTPMLSVTQSGNQAHAWGIESTASGSGNSNLAIAGIVGGSGTNCVAVAGESTGPSSFGVTGIASGNGSVGVGASSTMNASLNLTDSGVSVPGTSQVWSTGSFVVSSGELWFCTSGGTGAAATFVLLSAPLVTLASPVRIYDSRVGQLPSTGPKTPITTGATVTLDVTNNSSGVPDTASAVLGNITVTNSGNGYLTVYNAALGSAPATSSINLVPGVTLANNFTSACNPGHNIKVTCGGPGPTDFIVDIFGYYP
jgi:hypothetical protein